VANADIISAFWDGTMCLSWVHELGHKQSKTTKKFLDITTQDTTDEEAVEAAFTLGSVGMATGSGQAAPTKNSIKSAKKSAKGGKKGQKHRLHYFATVASNGSNREETDNCGEEFMATAKRDFKWWTWPPKDHFEKIFEAACLHHPYPIKHKLRNYTMMKKFMTSGAPSSGGEPGRDLGGKSVVPIPREVEVMNVTGWSHPKTRNITWLVEARAPYSLWYGT
jgi:hypothetical protein